LRAANQVCRDLAWPHYFENANTVFAAVSDRCAVLVEISVHGQSDVGNAKMTFALSFFIPKLTH